MKKIFTLFSLFSLFAIASSQVTPGFYRVKNAETNRYLYVWDNEGYARMNGLNVEVDLDAVYLRKGLENTISDPASVIYVSTHGGKYDFSAQGTSVHDILGYYVDLTERSGHYSVGAEVQGTSVYLSDLDPVKSAEYGKISKDANGHRLWDAELISSSSANFFGVKPSITASNKSYASFYASFGFSPVSRDTKVYYVSKFGDRAVLLKEIEGDIPSATPVIIECTSDDPADNKLDLVSGGTSISDNQLKGYYFDTDNISILGYFTKDHVNQKTVESEMRFLNVNSEGKLVFSKNSNLSTVPANSSYLVVSSTAASELVVCFTEEEFENNGGSTSLDTLISGANAKPIYNLLGKPVESGKPLPAGIYIIGGKKTVIR